MSTALRNIRTSHCDCDGTLFTVTKCKEYVWWKHRHRVCLRPSLLSRVATSSPETPHRTSLPKQSCLRQRSVGLFSFLNTIASFSVPSLLVVNRYILLPTMDSPTTHGHEVDISTLAKLLLKLLTDNGQSQLNHGKLSNTESEKNGAVQSRTRKTSSSGYETALSTAVEVCNLSRAQRGHLSWLTSCTRVAIDDIGTFPAPVRAAEA